MLTRDVVHQRGGGIMDRATELTQLIVSCWLIAAPGRPIPTSHGVLDRALRDLWGKEELPEWARGKLHFVDSRVGLQCVELPVILDRAQKAQLTAAPNPSYSVAEPRISQAMARRFLKKLNVAESDARRWGTELADAADRAADELETFELSHQSSQAAQAS